MKLTSCGLRISKKLHFWHEPNIFSLHLDYHRHHYFVAITDYFSIKIVRRYGGC